MSDIHSGAQAVLDFWFGDHGYEDWFNGGQRFDVEVRLRFADTVVAGQRSELWEWRTTARGRLAEIIVLDQFTRQLSASPAALSLPIRLRLRWPRKWWRATRLPHFPMTNVPLC
jgi:uncharacterized protein (DUF924 family)